MNHRTVDEGLKLLSKYVIPIALMDLKLREDWKVEIEKETYHIQFAGKDIYLSQQLVRQTEPDKVETLVDKMKAILISEAEINHIIMVGES